MRRPDNDQLNLKHPEFRCVDCDLNTIENDELGVNNYYMVHDRLWHKYFGKSDGMLCISCLETRMGRALELSDLTNYPINDRIKLQLLLKKMINLTNIDPQLLKQFSDWCWEHGIFPVATSSMGELVWDHYSASDLVLVREWFSNHGVQIEERREHVSSPSN